MDKIDKKLITLLQQNARMPLKALAEKVFLSSPAVSARIERLEKEEIIEGYEVKINQLSLATILRHLLIWRLRRCRSRSFIRLLNLVRMWWSVTVLQGRIPCC